MQRGRACGVHDLAWLSAAEAVALEPALHCTAAVLSPSTGIVDSHGLMLALQGDAEAQAAMLALLSPVQRAQRVDDGFELEVGGNEADAAARPLRGQQRRLACAAAGGAFRGPAAPAAAEAALGAWPLLLLPGKPAFTRLIYPMPNEAGLGVHVTLDLGGQMRFGPDVQWIPMAALGEEDYRVDPARPNPLPRPSVPTGRRCPMRRCCRPTPASGPRSAARASRLPTS